MASNMMTVKLRTGQLMPALGFGTWQASEEELTTALDIALEAGYRHIDTAPAYENEAVIGKILKNWIDAGKIQREELFITTKLPPHGNRPEDVEKCIKKSLERLQLDYLDLYLVHVPFAFADIDESLHPKNENGECIMDTTTDHVAVWREMEQQVLAGRTKAIGLSNFNMDQLDRVINIAKVPVSNLQIELHVYCQQKEMMEYCFAKGVTITAYSPLGSRGLVRLMGRDEVLPDMLKNDKVLKIAEKHGKTPAQIVLRYLLYHGIAAIPKSTNPQRIKENIDIFDLKLDGDDIRHLSNLDQKHRGRVCDFAFFKGIEAHPEFPF